MRRLLSVDVIIIKEYAVQKYYINIIKRKKNECIFSYVYVLL